MCPLSTFLMNENLKDDEPTVDNPKITIEPLPNVEELLKAGERVMAKVRSEEVQRNEDELAQERERYGQGFSARLRRILA